MVGGDTNTSRTPHRWWGGRFWAVMESIGLAHRLERGKRYARAERVLAVAVEPGIVSADVQGSRYEPYRAELGIRVFTEEEWERAVETLASQALFSAKLLAGEMPEDIEGAFAEIGLPLFPSSPDELRMTCTCPDGVVPCKHIAALHYVLADRLDEDPFLLFRWRGKSREVLLRELRKKRAAEASGRPTARSSTPSLEESLGDFWKLGESFDSISISVEPPAVSALLLKRLGLPVFWKPHPEIRGSLERLYAKVTERAMALAYLGRDRNQTSEEE
jgi:uncharacterized Zn finger protein